MSGKNLNLLREFIISDLKLRYDKSIFGFFWFLLKPLLMLGTLYLIFSVLIGFDVKFGIPNYGFFLLLGIILWNYLVDATTGGMRSLIEKGDLIKKVHIRSEIIILSSNFNAFITLFFNLVIFFLFYFLFGLNLGLLSVLFVFLLLELIILVLGLTFALSALYVKYRDMLHVWEVLLQIGFWITPIIYSASLIPEAYVKLYMLNPLARIISDSRGVILFNMLPELKHSVITFIIIIVVFIIGYKIFKKLKHIFAEEL